MGSTYCRPETSALTPGFELVGVEDDDVIAEFDKVPELADVLETCADAEIDPAGEEEEEERGGNIVGEKYRQLYREVSTTGQSNGDWLAERLTADTTNADGKMNLDDLLAIFERNGVDLSAKWALARFTQSPGWRGRFRMSGRNVLEKIVARDGVYFDGTGAKVTPRALGARQSHRRRVAASATCLPRAPVDRRGLADSGACRSRIASPPNHLTEWKTKGECHMVVQLFKQLAFWIATKCAVRLTDKLIAAVQAAFLRWLMFA